MQLCVKFLIKVAVSTVRMHLNPKICFPRDGSISLVGVAAGRAESTQLCL